MKLVDLSDLRARRSFLSNEDYAIAEGAEYVPEGKITRESWNALMNLPDNVLLITTDSFTHAIEIMQEIAAAWHKIFDVLPSGSPLQQQCLAAHECFEGGIFNAVNGWYRLAGIAIRNAIEDVRVGFYYQGRPDLAKEFEAVVAGAADSPRRNEMNKELARKNVPADMIAELDALYQRELSIYVHRTSDGAIWESNGPVFVFEQMCIWIGQYERAFRALCKTLDVIVPGAGATQIADAISFKRGTS